MSYQDPEALYGRLAAGDAGRIAAAADPITGAVSAVGRAGQSVANGARTAVSNWVGDASKKFGARGELSTSAAKAAGERLGAGADIVQAASRAYGQMRSAADNAIGVWRSRPPGLDEEQTRTLAKQVNESLTKVKSGYENVLKSYAGALGKITPGFQETAMTDCGWGRAAERAGGSMPSVPPPGTDPKAVADWWRSLTPAQQAELLRTKYQELGQLRGLPAEVLDTANRTRIKEDNVRFAEQRDQLDEQIAQRAKELGVDPNTEEGQEKLMNDPRGSELIAQRAEAARRADNAAMAAGALEDADRQAKGLPHDKKAYVMYWSPDGPGAKEGAMAVAFGNPDDAKNVAVCVPGTGSKLSGFSMGQAAELSGAMGADGAAIQWLGYDAPEFLPGQVDDPAQAKEGGAILAQDVAGYRAAGKEDVHVTVIGHSYGSTVVGYSAMDNGLAADDIAFVGSPGVGASNVDQLSAGRGHVYVGGTEHDPVVQATSGDWFTEDGSSTGPYDSEFGAKAFGTSDGGGIGGAHSTYYDHNSESLNNLAKIATGNGDSVSEQRWQDSPQPRDVLPGSDLPVVGPVLDWGTNTVKEAVDIGEDVVHGGGQVIKDVARGDFDAAAGHAWDTTKEVGGDVADVAVDTVGNAVEMGRDIYEGGKAVVEEGVEDVGGAIADGAEAVYDNTIGAIF